MSQISKVKLTNGTYADIADSYARTYIDNIKDKAVTAIRVKKSYLDLNPNLILDNNQILIIEDYEEDGEGNYVPAIKIGDGVTTISNLPIIGEYDSKKLLDHISNNIIHVTEEDRKSWVFVPSLQSFSPDPNKSKVWLDTSESEETQEEIPKEEVSSEMVPNVDESQILTLDEETGALTFEDGQELKAVQEDNEGTLISSEENEQLNAIEESNQFDAIEEEEQETLPLMDSDNNLTVIDDESEFKIMNS